LQSCCPTVYVDAPHIVQMPTDSSVDFSKFDSSASTASDDPELVPRGWWTAEGGPFDTHTDVKRYRGAEESIALLREELSKNVYAGVLGFSQGKRSNKTVQVQFSELMAHCPSVPGAALAAILQSSLIKDPHPTHPPFKFAIIVGGFRSVDPAHDRYYPIDARSVHIIGKNDVIVDEGKFPQSFFTVAMLIYWHGLFVSSTIAESDRLVRQSQGRIPSGRTLCAVNSSLESIF
jgi:hypothetical protein